jgi:hypothetical protein
MTLDFELDYGGRSNTLETLNASKGHQKLKQILEKHQVPMTAFVQTGILQENSNALEVLKFLADEFHSHSHTHASEGFDSLYEFETSLNVLKNTFDQEQFGYRAPFGKLYPGDHELLKELGFAFDASLFPSFRPGKFNNLNAPIQPHLLPCGLLEIPFGVLPHLRLILGVSYMKLLGPGIYRVFEKMFGLPRILVFYAHLHDFFPTSAIDSFSPALKMAFSRNREKGIEIADQFLSHLNQQGYQFLSMNELQKKLLEENL